MSVFSTNQVRQLYVVSKYSASSVGATSAIGELSVGTDDTSLYFGYKGADGTIMRSDRITFDKETPSVTVTEATSLRRPLKAVSVTLNSNINGGAPVGGQDYLLRLYFRQYVGMSDEDVYLKYGSVHATSGMSAQKFYKELAISTAKNLAKELVPLLDVYLTTSSSKVAVLSKGKVLSVGDGEYTGILLVEVEQEWTLGIKPQTDVYFEVQTPSIYVDGDEVLWGVVENKDSGLFVTDGKKIADLEYFCMGERGDVYRNIAWPHSIPTKYLVDATKEYDVIDIHYSYQGANEAVQKSEKTITLVIPTDASGVRESIVSAINAALTA